ncbi:hypothetical protein F0562_009494 [Nyssa sinensis]|uniref:Uncharacterized protein n=1 Tax=Nyssa sinensis TaxID=561372 RepID=A0A5J5A137_9ASTE|nr:hypothetical protein F0562_009494 [Nyssa sinensis]
MHHQEIKICPILIMSKEDMKKKASFTLACFNCAAVSAATSLVSAAWMFFAVAAVKIHHKDYHMMFNCLSNGCLLCVGK